MRWVAADDPLAIGLLLGPVWGQPLGFVGRQTGVVFHQTLGHAVLIRIGAQGHLARPQLAQLVQPLGITPRRLGRNGGRHAKPFQVDQAADALGSNAAVQHGHMTAHAVADQIDGLSGAQVVEQSVQVGQVVRKPKVVYRTRVAQAITAPIGRHDPAICCQGVDHKLKRCRHIHPAVQKHQGCFAGLALAPFAQVILQTANGDKRGSGGFLGLVHSSDHKDLAHEGLYPS